MRNAISLRLIWLLTGMMYEVPCHSEDCMDSVYMKIPYTTKLINHSVGYREQVSSAHQCLEICRNHATCKSVAIDTSVMKCYLYTCRVYAGLEGTVKSDIIYYWLLQHECPLHLGYSEDPISKICTKYNPTKMTWPGAQAECEREGGLLFMVDTPESTRVATEYVTSGVLSQWTFIGSKSKLIGTSEREWLNGVPVNNSLLFFIGSGVEPDCMALSSTPGLYVVRLESLGCYQTAGFICQVPTKQSYLP